jgi:hypothetical protein
VHQCVCVRVCVCVCVCVCVHVRNSICYISVMGPSTRLRPLPSPCSALCVFRTPRSNSTTSPRHALCDKVSHSQARLLLQLHQRPGALSRPQVRWYKRACSVQPHGTARRVLGGAHWRELGGGEAHGEWSWVARMGCTHGCL